MKKKLLLSLLLLCLGQMTSFLCQAQNSSVSYKFGDGLIIASADDRFSMGIRGRVVSFLEVDPDGGPATMGIKKARLNFFGHILSEKLTYSLQFGFAPKDNAATPNGNTNFIRDAVLFYKPDAHWTLGLGQAKVKANRSHMTSSQKLLFTERSIVDGVFEQDRDFGLFAEYTANLAPGFPFAIKTSVTSGDGRNFYQSSGSGLEYSGRVELYPLGDFQGEGAFSEGDQSGEEQPRLMIAGAFSYNDRALRTGGQTGKLMGESKNLSSYYADLVFKYRGFAFSADLMGRSASAPIAGNGSDFVYKGMGYNFQASYCLGGKWEMALRNSTLRPSEEVRSLAGYRSWNQTTLALTRYIIGHGMKIQADASYSTRSQSTAAYSRWLLRACMEIAF